MSNQVTIMRKVVIVSLVAVVLLVLAAGIAITRFGVLGSFKYDDQSIIYEKKIIKDVYTDKARYNPGDNAEIVLNLKNVAENSFKGDIYLLVKHLDNVVYQKKYRNIAVKSGEDKKVTFKIDLPAKDFQGYLLEVWYKNGSEFLDFKSTAIDVSSDWAKFPRYGYIASYPQQDIEKTSSVIQNLNKYHINGLQFYDWQYKHHKPVAESTGNVDMNWIEIANRKTFAKTVKDYIDEAHNHNIAAMNYNLLFGAWNGYEKDGVKREWGLFQDEHGEQQDYHPLLDSWASNKIHLFNPLNTEWQEYIINREKEVFKAFPFDGWHIDQLGDRGPRYDFNGKMVNLPKAYAEFIKKARAGLGEKVLVFNAVNQYGQTSVEKEADVDFLYAEMWSTDNYLFLKQAIDSGLIYSDKKLPTVIAAYMNYKKQYGEFNEHAVKLTDAVIFASGGSHIELGDAGMLSSEYFPSDKLKMSYSLKQSMRGYYDFLVAYQNYLRDNVDAANKRVEIENIKTSGLVSPKSVWYFARARENHEILHLINFLANSSNEWRDDTGTKQEPPLQENFKLKYYTKGDYKKVMLMSPDFNSSRTSLLKFDKKSDEHGDYIEITVPKLYYWDMIVFEKNS